MLHGRRENRLLVPSLTLAGSLAKGDARQHPRLPASEARTRHCQRPAPSSRRDPFYLIGFLPKQRALGGTKLATANRILGYAGYRVVPWVFHG